MYEADFNAFIDGSLSLSMTDAQGVAAIQANYALNGWLTQLGITAQQLWELYKQWMGLTPRPNPFSVYMRNWWISLGHPFDWLVD